MNFFADRLCKFKEALRSNQSFFSKKHLVCFLLLIFFIAVGVGTHLFLRYQKSHRTATFSFSSSKSKDAIPVAFKDLKGSEVDISSNDKSISADLGGGNIASFKKNKGDDLLKVQIGKNPVGFSLIDASDVSPETEGSGVSYPNMLPSADVNYKAFTDHIKEEIILRSSEAPKVFTFQSHLARDVILDADSKGGIIAKRNGENFFYLHPLFVSDANGKRIEYVYEINKNSDGYLIKLLPKDESELNDATYPITVDPTISWDFTVSANYILSDPAKIEISSNVLRLKNNSGSYATDNPYAVNRNPILYSTLSGFSETLGNNNQGSIQYELSVDGTIWYWWNGSAWTKTTTNDFTQSNPASTINSNIGTFAAQVGTGGLFFKAFLHASDSSKQVELQSVSVTYVDAASAPGVTSIAANSGSVVGGNDVTIKGNNFIPQNSGGDTGWATVAGKTLPGTLHESRQIIIGDRIYLFGGFNGTTYTNVIYSAPVSDPTTWTNTGKVLPVNLYASQIAVIGNYVYLFGGYNTSGATSAIFRAPISDPTTMTDTGKTLPGALYASMLSIIGDKVYLFGGGNSAAWLNVIYSAPISDPTTWTNTGKTLPAVLSYSQTVTIGNYVYLFGGYNGAFLNPIYRAPVSDPTTWTNTGKTLPGNLAATQLAIIGDNMYLIGGNSGSATNVIYTASITDPTNWKNGGKTLPGNFSNSQMAIIGNYIYLFGGNNGSTLNTILRAPISHFRPNVYNKSWLTDWTTNPGYTDQTAVSIGGSAATNVNVVDQNTIIAKTPAHAAGTVDVAVTNYDGQQSAALSGGFTYVAPSAPNAASISPSTGLAVGGTNANITGTNFIPKNSGGDSGWTTVTGKNLPSNLYGPQQAVIGNTIYLFGGNNGSATNKIYSASVTDPTTWTDTGKTLPGNLYGSQLAVVGEYVYLFGGYNGTAATNVIYSAPLTDPTTWTNTGKTLPGNLYTSQLSIIGGNIYLFGGHNGSAYVSVIYSAPVSNPTTWTNAGKTLPGILGWSHVGVFGDTVYLFGGYNGAVTNVIYSAPVTDPTTWTNTGKTLPVNLYGSQLLVVGDNIYLLGGYNTSAVSAIYKASVSSPTSWSTSNGTLPVGFHVASSAVIDNYVYMFGGYTTTGISSIFRAPLSYFRPNVFNKRWQTNWETVAPYTDQSNVSIGGNPATAVSFRNQTTINVNTPAHAAGATDVTVTSYDGQTSTISNGFTYTSPSAPIASSISPTNGALAGGNNVTVSGTNFIPANSGGDTGWTISAKTLPSNLYGAQQAVIGDTVYLFGGYNGTSYLNTIYSAPVTDPTNFTNTGKVLPSNLTFSQLAVIGNYAYLFGGYNGSATTNIIYSAPISDPTNWTNTGKVIPAALYGSQVSVIGNYVYLFGGYNGSAHTNTIYSAPVSDPTTWTNTGKTLPGILSDSQLVIIGNNIYLFGGYNSAYTNVIYSASITDPTTWTNTGKTIPAILGWSQSAVIGDYVYLFGGWNGAAVNTIFRAPISDPTTWSSLPGTLPGTTGVNSLLVVGNNIYLYGGQRGAAVLNTIYQAPISHLRPNVSNNSWLTDWPTIAVDQSSITFGGAKASNIQFTAANTATAITPAHTIGTTDVVITNYDGQSATMTGAFNYNGLPTITSVTPSSVAKTGGDSVVISGTNFLGTPTVSFGGTNSPSVTLVNSNTLSVVVPAHNVGIFDLTVTNLDGQSATLANGITFVESAPAASTVSPNSAPVEGNSIVTISGSNFTPQNSGGDTGWTTVAGKTLPSVLQLSQQTVIGDHIYLFGGYNSAYMNKIYSASVFDPTTWTDTGKTLPGNLGTSQVAVIGNYVYLFGGYNGSSYVSSIYRASVSDPTTWTNTGKTLPGALASSQLSIVGNSVYLFGGYNGAYTNVIYSAPISDPTTWTNTGKVLPSALAYSNSSVIGDRVYLFGGYNGSAYTNVIYSAPISDPTTWVNTGKTLPAISAYSQIVTIGNNVYLLGGWNGTARVNSIYSAPISDPTTWTNAGKTLPVVLYASHAAVIGNYVYLFGGDPGSTTNAIYRAPVSRFRPNVYNKTWLTDWSTIAPYTDQSKVTFGGTQAPYFSFQDANTIVATTPAHSAGPVDVTVTGYDGQTSNIPNGFTYTTNPAPSASSVNPNNGSTLGGNNVTVSGTNFIPQNSGGSTGWTTVAGKTIPGPLYGSQQAVIGDRIYLFGGYNGSAYTNVIYSAPVSDPTNWTNTGRVLPINLYGSQVAVVGNYVYLFGGQNNGVTANVIYRAPINDPTNFINTGKTLPGVLVASQLSIIGNNIYLFGGANASTPTNVIYSALLSDPTTWTNTGKTLPGNLSWSQSAVIGDYVYLFGGYNGSAYINVIYSAPVSDPTNWTNTGKTMPGVLDLSQLVVIGNYVYLLGGYNNSTATNQIYSAPISDPTTWTNTGNTLPANMYVSHSAVIGNYVYLFGGYTTGAVNTIYRAPISHFRPNVYNKSWLTDWPTIATDQSNVTIGGTQATNLQFTAADTITATTPVNASGTEDVVVTNYDGQSSTISNGFTFISPPTISGITPPSAIKTGGDTVTISGSDFYGTPTVSFGGTNSSSVTLVNSNTLSVVVPAHNPGTYDVVVTNPDGQIATLTNGIWIMDFAPGDLSMSPTHGPTAGKTDTTISGTNFIPGFFGGGADGAVTVNANININASALAAGRTCADAANYSVTALSANTATITPTPTANCLTAGDEILLINLQGGSGYSANIGNYETLKIQSIASNVITFTTNKSKYYGNSSGSDANIGTAASNQRVMLQRVPNYSDVTINSGYTLTASGWNGVRGGVLFFRASGIVINNGTIDISSKGYRGGAWCGFQIFGTPCTGYQGESFMGVGGVSINANYGAGGGGYFDGAAAGVGYGGNAGHATAGSNTGGEPSYSYLGAPGQPYGVQTLDKLYLGSGGGGGAYYNNTGGIGGGIAIIAAKNITVNGALSSNGQSVNGYAGDGAGGSVLLFAGQSNLGSGLTRALGGRASNGRIAIRYESPVSGTTSPASYSQQQSFNDNSSVMFDGIPATNVRFMNSTTIKATVPAHPMGWVDVKVTNYDGRNVTQPQSFEYIQDKFAITSSQLNLREGESGMVTVQAQDSLGNPVSVLEDTTMTLSSTSQSGFFARDINEDLASRWNYNTVVIPAGQSSVNFYYMDNTKGTPTISVTGTASASTATATQQETISSKYRFLVTGVTNPIKAGIPSSVTIQAVDYQGNPLHDYTGAAHFSSTDGAAILPSNFTFTSTMLGGHTFINGVTMLTQGNWCVTATDTNDAIITGSQCSIDVSPPNSGTIAKLKIITSPQNFGKDSHTNAITVQTQDVDGVSIPVSSATPIYIYSDSIATGQFSLDGQTGWSSARPFIATIPKNATSVSFYYRDTTLGAHTLTVREDQGTGADIGWINDSQIETTVSGNAFKLALNAPLTTTKAGETSGAFTVSLQDSQGNIVTALDNQLIFAFSDKLTGQFSVTTNNPNWNSPLATIINAGNSTATFYYQSTQSGTHAITVSDGNPADGTTGLLDDSKQVTVSSSNIDHFAFLTNPFSATVGQVSSKITIQAQDQYNNPVYLATPTDVYLSANNPGGQFSSSAAFSSTVSHVTIAANASSADAYFKQSSYATSQTITATDNASAPDGDQGIKDATQTETLTSGAINRFVITNGAPLPLTAGTSAGPVTLALQNQYGVNIPAPADTQIYFYTNSTGSIKEFSLNDGASWSAITSATIPSGATSFNFYYKDSKAGTQTITVADESTFGSDTGITNATLAANVSASAAVKLAFGGNAQTLELGQNGAFSVQAQDVFDNPQNVTLNTNVYLTSDSPSGLFQNGSGQTISSVVIPMGSSSASFYYQDTNIGTPTISLTDNAYPDSPDQGLTNATQIETIINGTVKKFSLSASSNSLTAGIPVMAAVHTLNAYDQIVPTTGALSINLSSNSTGGAFDISESGTFALTSVTVPSGQTSADFFYKDTKAGSPMITASKSSYTSSTYAFNIEASTVMRAVFINSARTTAAGSASAAFTLQFRDQYGNVSVLAAPETISLSTSEAGGSGAFSTNGTEPWDITQVTASAGASSISFYYKDTKSGAKTIAATPVDYVGDSQQTTITGAAISYLQITSDPQTIVAQTVSAPITIQAYDQYNNLTVASSSTTLNFSSTSSHDEFSLSNSSWSARTSATLAAGQGAMTIYYKDWNLGNPTVTIGGSSIASATQQESITVGAAAKVVFGGSVQTIITDTPSKAITFNIADANGYAVNAATATTVTLTSSSVTGEFSANGIDGWATSLPMTIATGSNQQNVYYRDSAQGTKTLTASVVELSSATQNINIITGVISKIIFDGANGANAGVAVPVVVQLETSDDLPAAKLSDTLIDLSATSGSFSLSETPWVPISSINIPAKQYQAALYYKDTVVGNKTITADEHVSEGWTAASKTIAIASNDFHKFSFIAKPNVTTLNVPSSAFSVEMQDQYGNVVIAQTDTTLYAYSSGSQGAFSSSTEGPWTPSSFIITAGSSATSFYYKDSTIGTRTITVSDKAVLDNPDTDIINAVANITIAGQTPTKLAFTSSEQSIVAGAWTGAITIEAELNDGTATILGTPLTLNLSENPAKSGIFSLTSGGSQTQQVTIPVGSTSAVVYYSSTSAGAFTMTASAGGVASASQSVTVSASTPKKLAYMTAQQSKAAGMESDRMRVQLEDQYGNPTNATENTTLALSSTSATGSFSIQNGASWSSVQTVELSSGSNDVFFYYKDTAMGDAVLSVDESPDKGYTNASQTYSVSAGPVASIAFVTSPQILDAGEASGVMHVILHDEYGNVKAVPFNLTLYLYSDSVSGTFSTQSNFSSSTNQITIVGGQSVGTFYYKDTQIGNPEITVSDQPAIDNPDVGASNGIQTEEIQWGNPKSLVIENGASAMIAGQSKSFDVVLKNNFGIEMPASSDMAVYLSSTHASGKFSLTNSFEPSDLVTQAVISHNASRVAVHYSDTASGSVTVTASDVSTPPETPDISITNAEESFSVIAGDIVSFAFISAAQSLEAGQPSGEMTIQSRDAYGNVKTVGADTPVYLFSTSASAVFSETNNFSSLDLVDHVTIQGGSSVASFHFKNTEVGNFSITATDQETLDNPDVGIVNATQTESITQGNIAKLKIIMPTGTLIAGGISEPVTVETLNQYDIVVPTLADTTIYLSSTSNGASFSANVGGPWSGSTIVIPSGGTSAQFYYRDSNNGTPTLTVSDMAIATPDNGWTNDSGVMTVEAGEITQIAFLSIPQLITARHPSASMRVETRNIYGNPTAVTENTNIYLRSSSLGGEFSAGANGPWGDNFVLMPKDESIATFYYHDSRMGNPTITVSDNLPPNPDTGWTNTAQQETIISQNLDHFLVANISDPQVQGEPSSVVVMAQDGEGYIIDWYSGTIRFTSSDSDAILPTDYTFTQKDKGMHTFTNSVAFLHSGEKWVRITDEKGTTGVQNDITVSGNTGGAISKLIFTGVTPPIILGKGVASQTITIEGKDSNDQPSNAGPGGFPVRLTSAVSGGEFSLTPTGPWISERVVTIPENLSSINIYYRNNNAGPDTISVSDWKNGTDNSEIENDTLDIMVKSLSVNVASSLQVNNNAHYYVDSPIIFGKNDTGYYYAKDSFAINVRDSLTGDSVLAKNFNVTWKDPSGNVIDSQSLQDVSTYSYVPQNMEGYANEGNYTLSVEATDADGIIGSQDISVPVSGWKIDVTYDATSSTVGDPITVDVKTYFNGVLADPDNFSVNLRDNNGEDVADSRFHWEKDAFTKTSTGTYQMVANTAGLTVGTDPQGTAYFFYAHIYDPNNNSTTWAEDNHYDIFFKNNPTLAPKNFQIEKILTSSAPSSETYDLKFKWDKAQYATKYNLYRTRNRFATLFSDPCSIDDVKSGHRFGDNGATAPYCETNIQQNVGADDSTQWVRMAEVDGSNSDYTVPWSQIQDDLPNNVYYYIIRAENALGESGYSTMNFSLRKDFATNVSPYKNTVWVSLPYYIGDYTNAQSGQTYVAHQFTKASDVVKDIEGDITGTSGDDKNKIINRVAVWNPNTQNISAIYSYNAAQHRWGGSDFDINPGDGVSIQLSGVTGTHTWTIVGHDATSDLTLNTNAAPYKNTHWISFPYSSKYHKVSDIVLDFEGSLNGSVGDDKNRKINRVALWSSDTQNVSAIYSYNAAQHRWGGNDFVINPGDGISIQLSGNEETFGWTQPLIINPYQ